MRGVVTTGEREMRLAEDLEPPRPGEGEVLIRPEVVGLCGSDFHIYAGEEGDYPLVQGHEFCAVVEELGPGCGTATALREGQRVAVWPLVPCGSCYPCRIGRVNRCATFSLLGVTRDGALRERLSVPADQVFPCGELSSAAGAFVEPTSIAVQAVWRGRVAPGEQVVVFGAGPIGQACALAATDVGARALLIDPVPERLRRGERAGVERTAWGGEEELADLAAEWTGGEGPAVVLDTTAKGGVLRQSVEMVAPTGRVVAVGLSEDPLSIGVGVFCHKEVDLLGTSCCTGAGFAAAVELVRRHPRVVEDMVTHRFPMAETEAALRFAIDDPARAQKVVVDITG